MLVEDFVWRANYWAIFKEANFPKKFNLKKSNKRKVEVKKVRT